MNKIINKKGNNVDTIILAIFAITIITITLVTYFSTNYINHYTDLIQENIENRLFAETRAIQGLVSVEELQSYQNPEDMEKEDYIDLMHELQKYAVDHDLMFIYYMRLLENGQVQYIIDSDPNPETHYGLDHFEEPYDVSMKAFNGEPSYNAIGEYVPGWDGVLTAYIPIFNEEGEVIAVAGVDISDADIVSRRDSARRFTLISVISTAILGAISLIIIVRYRKKAEDANEASVAKGQFLSKMSHEIRTPMNAIIGFCRMAKNTDSIEKKSEYLDNISASSDYLLELINSILDLSKIEANKMTLNLEKTSIYKIMKNINIILESQVIKKSQRFSMDIDDNIPPLLYCDETRLKQIMVNLTANAIKFTPENGDISIKINLIEEKNNACNIEFVIKDSGIGIKEENLSKLFTAFEQADGSITRKYGGTGLGLTISKHFVEMMNGKIMVTSEEGKGSTFKFNVWFDIAQEDEGEENIELSEEKLDCSEMIFLVAEDSLVNQIIEKDILEGFGAIVEFANNGKECVEMFINNPLKYKLIFMDIQMPEMGGLEATQKIRSSDVERATDIPIVAMTAEVFQEDINNAINAGMNGHLGKPLKISEIVEVIKKVIEK